MPERNGAQDVHGAWDHRGSFNTTGTKSFRELLTSTIGTSVARAFEAVARRENIRRKPGGATNGGPGGTSVNQSPYPVNIPPALAKLGSTVYVAHQNCVETVEKDCRSRRADTGLALVPSRIANLSRRSVMIAMVSP